MSDTKRKFFTCACGRVHEIKKGEPILCQSKGHTVYRTAAYYEEEKPSSPEPETKKIYQPTLFQ